MSAPWCAMEHVPALDEDLKKTLGPATAKVLAEHLGLHTALDLLHHYPRRYAERGELTSSPTSPTSSTSTSRSSRRSPTRAC